ncbi:2-oxoglutarate dehydrogenase complex dihydrolipoyllysine-residue succinyltransferase [Blattabacterium cuenoti]|uniref:2-oxoglutarate dehydrogenase complex dihydrolipoyllysine-residue succinyltransferase n=1 Tax=Blattabacterium cuenoti TaxID=1653831 RepID=UPI00163D0572|nr:2-oxoglutarate dehydrogenase complex dihydrolipoyllysine-residue succinyltransferase [Blattabacterium cuenoti]
MIIQIKVPSPGESVTEVEISSWFVQNGDYVQKGQILAEIESDKATLEIPSEYDGLIKFSKKVGDKIKVGDILCYIDILKKKNKEKITNNYIEKKISPASRKMLQEKKISLDLIKGTGKHGAITKQDCINYELEQNSFLSNKNHQIKKKNIRLERTTPLSSLRKKISDRLVSIKNKTASLTTFNEVDMNEIFIIRKRYKDIFKKKHGLSLGFMSFFTISCVRSLKMYPDINAMIEGSNKVNFEYYDISIAISGPKGLFVPVIKNVEYMSFKEIEKEIDRLSKRVKNGKISINEMTGGTFTITNGGIFGSMLSTPIINPPQSAILGMHQIKNRVVVINGSIQIRPIMYLALTYDHRIIDGKEAVGFLSSIKESIENPIKFLMGGKVSNINQTLDL